MTLGEKLKHLREDRGLYQTDLEDVMGVKKATISCYENDTKKPKHETLLKIAAFYGVTIDYLLGNENSIDNLEEDFPEGVQILRRATKELSPDAKKKMIQLMKAFLEED